MRILVVGGGGREHALCWKLAQSPNCEALFCAPGNAGIAEIARIVPIPARETTALADWAATNAIDLAVIGPDDPLADGIVDALHERSVVALGPTRAAAEIEWSKSWAKRFCVEHQIPTAAFATFDDPAAAHSYVDARPPGTAIKADGLALGKGVFVCPTRDEAHAAIDRLMVECALGSAGARVVVEELLRGRELSAIALCDGSTYRMLPLACDHKAVFDGDRGPNTGGMGSFSPVPWIGPEIAREIELRVIAPAVRGMAADGRPFVGFLFAGLMLTDDGIRVIEFNSRMGDPEAQVILPRLAVDLPSLLMCAARGRLSEAPMPLPQIDDAACCVVAASGGYPGEYRTGLPIDGLDRLPTGTVAFHSGTRRDDGRILTAGGRVIGITGIAPTLERASALAYDGVSAIRFEAMHFRRDIGRR